MTRNELIEALSEYFGAELPQMDAFGRYDLADYDWEAGCYSGTGRDGEAVWFSLRNVVEAIEEAGLLEDEEEDSEEWEEEEEEEENSPQIRLKKNPADLGKVKTYSTGGGFYSAEMLTEDGLFYMDSESVTLTLYKPTADLEDPSYNDEVFNVTLDEIREAEDTGKTEIFSDLMGGLAEISRKPITTKYKGKTITAEFDGMGVVFSYGIYFETWEEMTLSEAIFEIDHEDVVDAETLYKINQFWDTERGERTL